MYYSRYLVQVYIPTSMHIIYQAVLYEEKAHFVIVRIGSGGGIAAFVHLLVLLCKKIVFMVVLLLLSTSAIFRSLAKS